MRNTHNEASTADESRGLPTIIRVVCYLLLVVILLVCVFLGIKSYGRVSMKTTVGYSLDASYTAQSSSLTYFAGIFSQSKIDNATITVVNGGDIPSSVEGAVQSVRVTIKYEQYSENGAGNLQTSYKTVEGTYIVFDSNESASKYCEQAATGQSSDTRDRFTVKCYYFDLPKYDEGKVYASGELTVDEMNTNAELDAINGLYQMAENLGAIIYKVLG